MKDDHEKRKGEKDGVMKEAMVGEGGREGASGSEGVKESVDWNEMTISVS